ncbi:MAG: hypothetical protein ACR2MO_00630, partial [Acidimicrobiales bacterium]
MARTVSAPATIVARGGAMPANNGAGGTTLAIQVPTTKSKPHIDWDDATARAALIDTRARDAYACLAHLDGTEPGPEVADAAALVA